MCSAHFTDDRTAIARIRDAAIARIAEVGAHRATIRDIAREAGVSPGLVLHHFGSKEGLRDACDDYVIALFERRDAEWMETGQSDPMTMLAAYEEALPITRYLARSLVDDSPSGRKLFDGMVAATENSLQLGVENGLVKPSKTPRDRAVLMVAWQLGGIVLSRHMQRAFGIDGFTTELVTRIGRVGAEVLTEGMFADSRYVDAARQIEEQRSSGEPPPEKDGATVRDG